MSADARLARLRALEPAVRIYQLHHGDSWWTWLCRPCLARALTNGWTIREEKDPPHPITCDECGPKTKEAA